MKKKNNWKPISVDGNLLQSKEFEDFGGIEELHNYEIIKAGDAAKKRKKQIIKSKVTKKKTRCVEENIRNKGTFDSQSDEEIDMSSWPDIIHPNILKALKDLKFYTPTKIQDLSIIPAIRDRLDILGAAETGSGKTLAFGIPIITRIISLKENDQNIDEDESKPLYSLVMSPTRELAIQIKDHLQKICKYTDIKISTVVGGMAPEKQKRILKKCPEIVVATPGRLWELIEEGEPHLNKLPYIKHLVIDEADRMLEKGHFAELSQILNFINSNSSNKRQNFVFSATLTFNHETPKRLMFKKKSEKFDQKAKLESLVNTINMKQPKVIDITKKNTLVETLSESVIMCNNEEKDLYLYYFLTVHPARTIVFCNSIDCVRRLRTVLEYLNCPVFPLHAQMHQKQRLKNLERFASSSVAVLLATDVAARGLDIKGIENVIHYQMPRVVETYIHRSGRTARAENEGLSLLLIEPQEGPNYKKICKTLNNDKALPNFPVDNNVLKMLRERVALTRAIDKLEHRMKRLSAQNRWMENAAKEMDVDIDDENLLNDLGSEQEIAAKNREIKMMKKKLKAMLNKPIILKTLTGSYPTKSGKLMCPEIKGSKKAITAFKNCKKF